MLRSLSALVVVFVTATAHAGPNDKASAMQCIASNEKAQELERSGKLIDARQAARSCSAGCPADIVSDCTSMATRLETAIPSIVVSAKRGGADVTDAAVTFDGANLEGALSGRAVEVDPGPHKVAVRFADGQRVEIDVVIRQGEKGRLIEVAAPSGGAKPPSPKVESEGGIPAPPALFWVFGALSVASFGTTAALGALAISGRSDLDACVETKTCAQADIDDVHTKALVADVFIGVGSAALLGAVLSWALWPRDEAPAKVSIGASPDGATFTMNARF